MPKRILIPIDFSVESLNTLKRALDGLGDTPVEAILMYSEYLSDSITELLFYSTEGRCKELTTPVFQEAISILKNKYEKTLMGITITLFHGYNAAAFKSFVQGQKIDILFIPKFYTLQPLKKGFDPVPIIKKSKLIYHEMGWAKSPNTTIAHQLSYLFD